MVKAKTKKASVKKPKRDPYLQGITKKTAAKKAASKRPRLAKKVSKPEPVAMSPGSLAERAMLVKLTISCWGAKRNDHNVAQEVADKHQSDATMGRFTKVLLKSENREKFLKVAREAKVVHRRMTLPWDEGVGLLPASMYFKFTEAMSEKRRKAEEHIEAFVKEYAEQWNGGMSRYKAQLGSLFDENDYPEPDRVRSKYGIRVRTFPISDPNDFRVQMSEEAKDALKAQMFQDYRSELEDALKIPFVRLHRVLSKVQEKLSEEDAIFRDSLIDNVREMVELLPALNITGNKDLEALLNRTNKEVAGIVDMKALRKDPKFRKQVAASAASILKGMKGYVS